MTDFPNLTEVNADFLTHLYFIRNVVQEEEHWL